MYIYAGLFESMMAACGRIGCGRGPIYTVTMLALGAGVTLNLLSIVQLLWTLGVLDNPYRIDGDPHSQRYLFATLYLAFLANTVLARVKFSADQDRARSSQGRRGAGVAIARIASCEAAAPLYVLSSAALFILTLSLSLHGPG